ncbi:beta-defensin 106A-like [Macrotis lagotis]|uniref:beta-defensin 106A-like n=1 Tax=Macrotis lagotis TaxID=92651 RepID=UPI003D68818E
MNGESGKDVEVAGFFNDKCEELLGSCTNKCRISEEIVALCNRFQKCCRPLESCQ